MKSSEQYLKLFESMCKLIQSDFEKENPNDLFNKICIKLTEDFLPPIDREDLAELSLILLKICRIKYNFDRLGEGVRRQINELYKITEGLIKHKKTCGEDIRRLIILNIKCENELINAENSKNRETELRINRELFHFFKYANYAFFKNL